MKKRIHITLAVMLCAVVTAPAWAIDVEFKGDWRTRAYLMQNFTGEDRTEDRDGQLVDTRTRLQFNAAVNDQLRLMNQFEMEAVWGGANYGKIDTDGETILIKHTYADFTIDTLNIKVGAQPVTLARGFLLDADFAGVTATYTSDTMNVPMIWAKHMEGGLGKNANDNDSDYLVIAPRITLGDMSANPYLMTVRSREYNYDLGMDIEDFAIHYLGVDVDARMDVLSAWATVIYQMGSFTPKGETDVDVSGWLIAMGGEFGIGELLDIHGQFFAASGQDPDKKQDHGLLQSGGRILLLVGNHGLRNIRLRDTRRFGRVQRLSGRSDQQYHGLQHRRHGQSHGQTYHPM